jgi:hypothetical protein
MARRVISGKIEARKEQHPARQRRVRQKERNNMLEVDNLTQGGGAENGPTGTAAILAVVRNVFVDPDYDRVGIHSYRTEIDGVGMVGVLAATKSQQFADSMFHVLNEPNFANLLEALDAGRLQRAYVVTAVTNELGRNVVVSVIEARKLAEMLKDETTRVGRYGKYYLVPGNFEGGF